MFHLLQLSLSLRWDPRYQLEATSIVPIFRMLTATRIHQSANGEDLREFPDGDSHDLRDVFVDDLCQTQVLPDLVGDSFDPECEGLDVVGHTCLCDLDPRAITRT